METHKYSTMIIINPKADFFKMAEMAKNIITNNGGIIEDEHIELDKKLAYEIDGNKQANCLIIYFKGSTDTTKEYDREIKKEADVLRHLIIRN